MPAASAIAVGRVVNQTSTRRQAWGQRTAVRPEVAMVEPIIAAEAAWGVETGEPIRAETATATADPKSAAIVVSGPATRSLPPSHPPRLAAPARLPTAKQTPMSS